MEIKEIIKKYGLVLNTFEDDGKFYSTNRMQLEQDNADDMIKSRRDEIYQYLINEKAERQKKYEDRQQKIEQIEGLKEIQDAISRKDEWNKNFQEAMEKGDGVLPGCPQDDIDNLKKEYPRAAAYLLAERESYRDNAELASIGKKALEDIINGMDYNIVLKRMVKEQKEFADRHAWD